jgi:hypothetical protein
MSASSEVHVLRVNHLGVIPPKYMSEVQTLEQKSPDTHLEYISEAKISGHVYISGPKISEPTSAGP